VRADFHLHTRADKEFTYTGGETEFVSGYVDRLKQQNIRIGVITNHNKFDLAEFKALRKRASKDGIGLLPGVELSVNDGANGVHTLIVFSEEWLADCQDYINSFLNVAFAGKTPAQYEQENGRTNDDLVTTLKRLDGYNRDFFVLFAHVEAASGLWNELHGGRMEELAQQPLIQKYCLGFQKVRTHDKPGAKCRVQVQKWWGDGYPAEVEGSDPKKLEEIGRGQHCYLKIGDLTFGAVKFALTDFAFRVAKEPPKVVHSRLDAVRRWRAPGCDYRRESTQRQYALAHRARELGWPENGISIIDADLGLSGSGVVARSGFAQLTADVALGRVGLVLGLEVSRLARNNADWHRLIELAGLTDTLIGDADGIYHPALFNDRLLLGLKGAMAEHHPDAVIASILNMQGRKTARGRRFDANRIKGLRRRQEIPASPRKSHGAAVGEAVSLAQAAAALGVAPTTLLRYLQDGLIEGEQITSGAPWQVRLSDELRARFTNQPLDGYISMFAAIARLGMSRQSVLRKIKRGELEAIFVIAGRQKGIRVKVISTQPNLFEQAACTRGAV
jgi:DNA invertase Pin-like site-specific DNA recombinase